MTQHFDNLRRGFNWLGGAMIIARLVDFATVLILLSLLTKEQIGVASLVLSIAMVVEAFNGAGTGEAMIQAPSVSPLQLDSVFWLVIGVALGLAALVVSGAPLIERLYGISGMAAYFWPVAIKQPLVAAALISLSTLNRELQFERIAIVNVGATLAAALTRLGLAVAGAGTWALVAGFSIHGLYVLIGAQLSRPFRPQLRFELREIRNLLRFGAGASMSNAFQQLFKNIDFLLIGWLYGPRQLAIYRLAFDVAMEPAVAIGELVNRTALPVLARVLSDRDHLAQSFLWAMRRLVLLVSPLMAALVLAADPLTAMIHDPQGQSYAAAALPLKLLAIAALLRVTLQLLYPLLLGSGRPASAVRLSAVTLVLLSAGILAVGLHFGAQAGIIAVSAVWLAVYPLLLLWAAGYLRRTWAIGGGSLAAAFAVPGLAVLALVLAVTGVRLLTGIADPAAELAVIGLLTALTYLGTFLYSRTPPSRPAGLGPA